MSCGAPKPDGVAEDAMTERDPEEVEREEEAIAASHQTRRPWTEQSPFGTARSRSKEVLVVGLSGAGKSSLIQRLIGNASAITFPSKTTRRTPYSDLTFVDVPGNATARKKWKLSLSRAGVMAVLFVFDVADSKTASLAKAYLQEVARHPSVASAPLLVVCNKWDSRSKAWEKPASILEFLALESQHPQWGALACSVVSGDGVSAVAQWLTGPRRIVGGDFTENGKPQHLPAPEYWPPCKASGAPFWE